MEQLNSWLKAERGRLTALANHLGVAAPNLVGWNVGRKPIPMIHAAGIEQFTGGAVTRKQMFPNDWQRIWPELAEPAASSASSTD